MWVLLWAVHNRSSHPIQLLRARLPHSLFYCSEQELRPPRKLAPGETGQLEFIVICREPAGKVIENAFNELKRTIAPLVEPEIHIRDGGPDRDNAHWYKYEVVKSGNESGKHVNFDEAHYFIKASIRAERERLVFVVSLHHVGRELSGIMEATAFARLESFEDSEDREYVSRDFFLCSLEPFVVTYKTQENEIGDSFDRWLDTALAVAIKEYGDRL